MLSVNRRDSLNDNSGSPVALKNAAKSECSALHIKFIDIMKTFILDKKDEFDDSDKENKTAVVDQFDVTPIKKSLTELSQDGVC